MAEIVERFTSIKPLEAITRQFKRSSYIENLRAVMYYQQQLLARVPPLIYAVKDTAIKVNEKSGNGEIKAILEVGSLTKRNLSDIKELHYVKENFKKISDEEYYEILNRVAVQHFDIDIVPILSDTVSEKKADSVNDFKGLLPKPPESMGTRFKGFDLHIIRTENEFNKGYELFDDPQERSKMDRQEIQIFDKNPSKNNVPVIIFLNEEINPVTKDHIGELLGAGSIQGLENYFNDTWKSSVKAFEGEFPKKHKEISSVVLNELTTGKYEIRHESIYSLALQRLRMPLL